MKQYPFEKLDVWNKAREMVKMIYQITASFPKDERFGLTQQIRRAIVSVASNLAEGSSRQSLKEQSRFSIISYGSLMEVLNQLILANDLGYITDKNLTEFRQNIEEISNKLNSLSKSQIIRYKSQQNESNNKTHLQNK